MRLMNFRWNWPLPDWLVARELARRIGGNDFLRGEKSGSLLKITNNLGIEVVLERRVQEYELLREHKYNLLKELKKGEKLWKVG